MTRPVRWGVLGYAGIARNQVIPAIVEAQNAAPFAVASRSREKLDAAVRKFGFERAYDTYEALLRDEDVEAVYIPLPNALHKEWTIKAIAAGKHVLCEKPLALTPEDCEEMIAAAEEKGVLLGEAFMYRFANRAMKLQELVKDGAIGEIRSIYASHRFVLNDSGDIRVNAALGGGSLWDVGCYPVNLIGMLLDAEPVSVRAEKLDFQGVDNALSAVLRYESGALCTLSCGFNGQCALLAEINGTKGSLILTDAFGDSDAPIVLRAGGREEKVPVPACHRYTMEVESFSDCVQNGGKLPYDVRESVRSARIIRRILKAAEESPAF